MDCCSGLGCEEFFDEKVARRDARRYRRKGLDATAREMVDVVVGRGVAEASVLEVGGGAGALQLELLGAGARRAVNLELSRGYDSAARELAEEAGVADRIERRVLDIAEQPEDVEPADVVVLHRVVCCYPDPERLVGAAADHAARLLVLSFPRRNVLSRLIVWTANGLVRLRGGSFRAHVHEPDVIRATAVGRGFERVHEHHRLVWQVAAFERP